MSSRRQFIAICPAVCAGAVVPVAWAQAMVDEKDAQAAALGYVADAAKADKVKFKNYAAGSSCATCAVYQGKAGGASGPCALFPGKQVSAKGWCSAWAKKA